MISENTIRTVLQNHLAGGKAFMPLTDMFSEITFEKVGERPYNLPYSFYELFYHITYAQKDILKFCISETYTTPNWPDDYWPKQQAPKSKTDWQQLQEDYLKDSKELEQLAENEALTKVVPTGEDQTLFREILLVIEHTAYHTGQLAVVLRLLGLHNK
ncbi:DinB family protein [uncultured Marixanthomonas sp.]|uniref:DinB family protein n=1 Tax=uncultured Marixanthomonas sp. TaxID=757245 RepID=UPI0030DD4AEB|tara:strand:- start:89027 stop:89500 length:474 start_codon:yes stop_codon:yes gene_type:complete